MEEKTPLRILLLADGRSPITRRWIAMLKPLGFHVSLVSSYPCDPVPEVASLYILPLAFSQFGGSQAGGKSATGLKKLIMHIRPLAQAVRHALGPWTLPLKVKKLQQIIETEQPDILHAMRIPYEGMLAGYTALKVPLVISTWGNDFTLHAPSTPRMSALTRRALRNTTALLSDTRVDVERAIAWGFDPRRPALVVPGNGGINLPEMLEACKGVVRGEPLRVLNPRGLRSYVRSDTFFRSIPLVLKELPGVQFGCTSMEDQPEALAWVNSLGLQANVRLLPLLSQEEVWREFAHAQVSVSASTHDGTPNTLLEAMALGCLPVCGDLPSIRAWITSGENGLLIDPADPQALADAVIRALRSPELQQEAAKKNLQLIREKADIASVRLLVKDFFLSISKTGVL